MLIYSKNITSLPNTITLFEGEKLDLSVAIGINIREEEAYEAIQTSTDTKESDVLKKSVVTVSLFNVFDVKEIEVETIEKVDVVPLGNVVGLKLYTSGVLVVRYDRN